MVTVSQIFFRRPALLLVGSFGLCFAQVQPTYDYRLVDKRCDVKQCLFIERAAEDAGYLGYMVGTARVTGYYGSIAREGSTAETIVPQKPLLCPALIVMNAPPFFQSAFRTLVQRGNTVNRLNSKGRLVLAINFSDLKASEISRIKRANRQHPVSLTLFKPPQTESGLPNCGSLFEILRVENAAGRN